MPLRKRELANRELYHIVTKSIAGFKIFDGKKDYNRMMDEIVFYMPERPPCEFHMLKELKRRAKQISLSETNFSKKLVKLIAYCIMPTHIHLILEQYVDGGISKFMKRILQSYSQYFNIKHKRKGPLWEGRFTNILIEDNDLFEHITRYIHLNPVTAYLVDKPEDWPYSSYKEYIGMYDKNQFLCNFSDYLYMNKAVYAKFVNDRIAYQRELAKIKNLILE